MRTLRRAQSALEYLFMLAAALILVSIVIKIISDSLSDINSLLADYTAKLREQMIQNL
ncbi:class III signal peptide-containing protein [Palaeococcus sp. (in: euryarchaeotes)]